MFQKGAMHLQICTGDGQAIETDDGVASKHQGRIHHHQVWIDGRH